MPASSTKPRKAVSAGAIPIWVYDIGEDGVQAFTDFGIENLIELIKFYKEHPELLRR
ncbi:hypothetical protein [Bradyrhizobium guangdongense]|uniref:Uncharacterized protein n=2 Tax=Bradyrhizobium guangdongense TaxID=1325090 RepID=A0AA88BCG9_9BRAD|nr:hypothetical protein [Bradyrhizobium guangdongense]GGI33442.1 hypothetical protein GCM10010987_74410 [Bradyrhizobium guangdongense]